MTEGEVRGRIVLAALCDLGTPYSWGGNDPVKDGGLDCSGAVLRWLRAGGLDLADQTADSLRDALPATDQPGMGDVAFYGRQDIATHVVLVIAPGGHGVIGANGGGAPRVGESAVEYRERMQRSGAGVRIEDQRVGGTAYRRDLLGFGRIPVELALGALAQSG